MIRVLLADDQTLVRQGIVSLLALTDDIRVTAEAPDGEAALARLTESASPPFDVVLLDVRMPKKSGLDVLAALRERAHPCPPTIILTTFDDDQVALAAVRLGASGYLLKDVSLEQLAGAVRSVARGETLHRPALTERAVRALTAAPTTFESATVAEPLTKRELQVLRLLAHGSSNREIGEALGAAEGTIKNHLSSILSKLGVRDRTRAVLKALELGLLT
jgi:DNA-binding NarL/FixJ family response regulator